jgi:hypothetical protein
MKIIITMHHPLDSEEVADLVSVIAGQIHEGYEMGIGDRHFWTMEGDPDVEAEFEASQEDDNEYLHFQLLTKLQEIEEADAETHSSDATSSL